MLPSLRARLDQIVERRRRTLGELEAMPEAQREFHPAAGVWSPADVARHLNFVEGKTTRVLAQRRVSGIARRSIIDVLWRQPLLWMYFGSPVRAKIPAASVAPDPGVPLATVRDQWESAHAMLAEHLETIAEPDTRAIVYRHPFGGYMDIFSTLRFVVEHHDHHRKQIARIMRAPGFPATTRGAPGNP